MLSSFILTMSIVELAYHNFYHAPILSEMKLTLKLVIYVFLKVNE